MVVVQEIRCSHCSAPIGFEPGEILATCRYCGYTVVIETGKVFTLKHSMFVNAFNPTEAESLLREWMGAGFLKPSDLAGSSKIVEKSLVYLPLWIVSTEAISSYSGVFERLAPPVMKNGRIKKKYDWLVLARKGSIFPTREYDLPLKGKIQYDFRKIEKFAKVLNSEVTKFEAVELAQQQIGEHHQFLAKQDVDRIVKFRTQFKIGDTIYLHTPIWFFKFKYKNQSFRVVMDGATGQIIKGEIPHAKIGFF